MRRLSLSCALLLIAGTSSFGASGIGISMIEKESYSTKGYLAINWLQNDKVVRRDTLVTTPNDKIKIIYCPVINTFGTHFAFIAEDAQDVTFIGVARIDDRSFSYKKIAPVVEVADRGPKAFNTIARLDWPRGDYLWYCPRTGSEGGKDGIEDIYRINVQTGVVEHVMHFGVDYAFRCLSWDSKYILGMSGDCFVYEVPDLSNTSAFPITMTNPKWNWSSGGCGHVMSRTGNYRSCQTNSGHTTRIMHRINLRSNPPAGKVSSDTSWNITNTEWNDWVVDKSHSWTCVSIKDTNNDGTVDTVRSTKYLGVGIEELCNTFARNSDDLIVLGMGKCSRMDDATHSVIDWKNKKSYDLDQFDRDGGCSYSSKWVEFWLQEPVDQIIAELRDDALDENRNNYKIEGLGNTGVRHSDTPWMLRRDLLRPGNSSVERFDITGRKIADGRTAVPLRGRSGIAGICVVRQTGGAAQVRTMIAD